MQAADACNERFDPNSGSEYIPTEDACHTSASRRKFKKELDKDEIEAEYLNE